MLHLVRVKGKTIDEMTLTKRYETTITNETQNED